MVPFEVDIVELQVTINGNGEVLFYADDCQEARLDFKELQKVMLVATAHRAAYQLQEAKKA